MTRVYVQLRQYWKDVGHDQWMSQKKNSKERHWLPPQNPGPWRALIQFPQKTGSLMELSGKNVESAVIVIIPLGHYVPTVWKMA